MKTLRNLLLSCIIVAAFCILSINTKGQGQGQGNSNGLWSAIGSDSVVTNRAVKINDGLIVQDATKTGHLITPRILSPDGFVHFGDSSLIISTTHSNRISWSTGPFQVSGARYGNGVGADLAYALNSIAIGNNVSAHAENAIIIGSGHSVGGGIFSTFTQNSLMVGFNSSVPTLFVGGGDGTLGSLGNVGIGTSTPGDRLEINSDIANASGLTFTQIDNTITPLTNPSNGVLSLDGNGRVIWVEDVGGLPDADWTIDGSDIYTNLGGDVGIGTSTIDPDSRVHIVVQMPPILQNRNGLFIDAPTLDHKGTISAFKATGGVIPGFQVSSVEGTYAARIGFVSAKDAAGNIIGGVLGYVKPKHIEGIFTSAFATGTSCIADLDNLTMLVSNLSGAEVWVGGMYAELRGTISNFSPISGRNAVAAVIGIDNIKESDGTGNYTYAGYFDGKVHIGDETIISGSNTDFQLAVDGKIVAKKIVTTELNWADDELEKDLTLEDLEKEEIFVDKNGHLQGIPSGKEVEKDGLDLSEMSSLKMRKIEQIFRYLFIFNKDNKNLQEDYKKLTGAYKKLEKENKLLKKNLFDLNKRVKVLEKRK